MDLDVLLEHAKCVARAAGHEILRFYGHLSDYDISYKEPGQKSPFTKADLASENIIMNALSSYDFGFLSEETSEQNDRLNKAYVWVIDPIDGTSDFINQTGDFTVLIGLAHNNRAVLGVVYWPVHDMLYFARDGRGAFRQTASNVPEAIHTSRIEDLIGARLLISRHHLLEQEQQLVQRFSLKAMTCGSAGLKMCKVAAGEADLYINTSPHTAQWDTCAAECILREAGGQVTDSNGGQFVYNRKESNNLDGFIASNSFIHQDVIHALQT